MFFAQILLLTYLLTCLLSYLHAMKQEHGLTNDYADDDDERFHLHCDSDDGYTQLSSEQVCRPTCTCS